MKNIQPESPELRSLKAKAIAEMDIQLMAKIRALEGEEFIYCEEFYDMVMVTSFQKPIPIVVSTQLEEFLLKNMCGG